MKITLLGGGLGSPDTLTLGAWKALQNAQVLVGARRVLESLPKELTGEQYPEIAPQKIVSRLKQAMEEGKTEVCVVLSGDVGFYSGARKLLPLLDFGLVEVLPGLSSPQYLASRLGMPWQDVYKRQCRWSLPPERPELPVSPEALTPLPPSPAPVSYTHLDVYKRQGLWRPF